MRIEDMFGPSGEKALLTEAAQGLGEQMALTLAEAGADVVVTDINLKGALRVAQSIQNIGRESVAAKVDITKVEDVENMVVRGK